MDNIVLSETKKNCTRTDADCIHIFAGLSKDRRATRGVSLLVRK